MKYRHKMPFGAEILNDETVRFQLWAPKAQSVSVDLSSSILPMRQLNDGWFELITRQARPGSRYRFMIDSQHRVPDPASRHQPMGVLGPSEVIDPEAFAWNHGTWRGRPWEEAVIYELHVGTFSPEGTFAGAERRLSYLAELGITAIELMPISSFPGRWNWGYDGVLPYAPSNCYGRPEDLKRLVDAAHSMGLMVFLDVVYNHFGPEGNFLHLYSPEFLSPRHRTPWGDAINFDGPNSRVVRDYFIHNALYWLEEYQMDGLRLDAVHAIYDDSRPEILIELADTVRRTLPRERFLHLVLENNQNTARYLKADPFGEPGGYTAQWNDDFHHALHVLLTGESDGYYTDYRDSPIWHLGRCLSEGYSYQGELSRYRGGKSRGECSRDLPPGCFISFLQNHDQIGNRVFGERITSLSDPGMLKAALAVLLLGPSPPLLFMGEEFAAPNQFQFFCDLGPDLASKVREGRRREFERFVQFNSNDAEVQIPDPLSDETFARSKLDWTFLQSASHISWLGFYRELLDCRRREIVPIIKEILPGKSTFEVLGAKAVSVVWPLKGGGELALIANFESTRLNLSKPLRGTLLYTTIDRASRYFDSRSMPPFSVAWFLLS
jgi:maltooligosyltrehalose trehalohydrolase